MIKVFVGVGLVLLAGGAYAVVDGWPYVVLERGFTQVILGGLSITAGVVLLALAATIAELRKLKGSLPVQVPASVPVQAPVLPRRDVEAPPAPLPENGPAAIEPASPAVDPVAVPAAGLPRAAGLAAGAAAAGLGGLAVAEALRAGRDDIDAKRDEPEADESDADAPLQAATEPDEPAVTKVADESAAEADAPAVDPADPFEALLRDIEAERDEEPSGRETVLTLHEEKTFTLTVRESDADDLIDADAETIDAETIEAEPVEAATTEPVDDAADIAPATAPILAPVAPVETLRPAEPVLPHVEAAHVDAPRAETRDEPGRVWWPRLDRGDAPARDEAPEPQDEFSALRDHLAGALAEPPPEPRKTALDQAESWMTPRAWPPSTQPVEPAALDVAEAASADLGRIEPVEIAEDRRDVEPEVEPTDAPERFAPADSADLPPAEGAAPAEAEPFEEPAQPTGPAASEEGIVGAYQVGETQFTIYADGSIQARTPDGDYTFGSMDELKAYLADEKSRLDS